MENSIKQTRQTGCKAQAHGKTPFSRLSWTFAISKTLILIAIFITKPAYAEENWKLLRNAKGINVYSRSLPDSKYQEFKGVVTVQATQASSLALLDDTLACAQWVHLCEKSEVLKQNATFERYIYQVSDLPFPAASRDVIFKVVVSQTEDGTVEVTLTSAPDYIGPTKYVRIRNAYGKYSLRAVGEHQTEITWTQYVDPTGKLPAFLVNSMVTDVPYNSLLNFRELVTTRKYQDAVFVYDSAGKPVGLRQNPL
ncbi:MAG: START domain-containing protein [bacterium]|nr:hypothetical protein [Gammaproteobacteria bacterium]HIL98623.1 hypothetical protein [Pseudomonadales bacterium]